jgi:hypothetical protein
MSHRHAHRSSHWQDSWGYYEFDDCPPRHVARTAVYQPPVRARLTVELPPCKPQGGVNTDWSGNKCAALRESPLELPTLRPKVSNTPDGGLTSETGAGNNSDAVMPQAGPEAPKTQQPAKQVTPEVGVLGQARGDDPSTFGTIGFYVVVALLLALALIVVRRIVFAVFGPFGGLRGMERDDAE